MEICNLVHNPIFLVLGDTFGANARGYNFYSKGPSAHLSSETGTDLLFEQKLSSLDGRAAERSLLEKGMHAMQRRSGTSRLVPDDFVITSLDVIIRHDIKLGEGGFGEVFCGEWQGVTVAVKVFDKRLPHHVRLKSLLRASIDEE